jgi:hypothetical protein
MKATITSQSYAPLVGFPDPHAFFGFDLEENAAVIRSDVVSLRTARVLGLELNHSAFTSMLVAITDCQPNDYLSLIGQVFEE